jgi:hypothetical protein
MPRTGTQVPPPLPPETRTVGQLVAESIRLYGARFWPSLALGIGPGLLGVAAAELHGAVRVVIVVGIGPLVLASSYAGAVALVRPIGRGRYVAVALAVGYLAFLPICVSRIWIFPGIYLVALGWLALVGLGVPAALVERRGYVDAVRRGIQLGRADYVHALGSLATLVIVVFLCQGVLFFILRGAGEAAIAVAGFLASLVISPLLFLGSALLYDDQAARVRSSKRDGALPRGKPAPPGPVRHPSSR